MVSQPEKRVQSIQQASASTSQRFFMLFFPSNDTQPL
jgi:hypothetical protein